MLAFSALSLCALLGRLVSTGLSCGQHKSIVAHIKSPIHAYPALMVMMNHMHRQRYKHLINPGASKKVRSTSLVADVALLDADMKRVDPEPS